MVVNCPRVALCHPRQPHGTSALSAYRLCMSAATAVSICETRFRQGDWWIWRYTDPTGAPSSWERYTVRASAGCDLVLDMASKFAENEPFLSHHRMRFSLADNLAARESPKQWAFKEFAFSSEGEWRTAPHRDNVQAFEEKFDAFLMNPVLPLAVRVERERTKAVRALGGGAGFGRATLVQSRRHAHTNAWYIREPRRHAGLAAFKAFGAEGGPHTYTFELVALGCAEDTDGAGPMTTAAEGRSPYG